MYSEQLEQLIKSVIADGVITEKERAVLHKKAASEGVDEDEIDVYVDGLVAQMKPIVKQEQKFDLKYLNKSKKDTYTVYEGKNLYRVNGFAVGRIQELYLNFFKLNLKLPFLFSEDRNQFRLWKAWFPESNRYIGQNIYQPRRTRLVQQWAAAGLFPLVRLYCFLINHLYYGIRYRR